jgi:hypothetical protein
MAQHRRGAHRLTSTTSRLRLTSHLGRGHGFATGVVLLLLVGAFVYLPVERTGAAAERVDALNASTVQWSGGNNGTTSRTYDTVSLAAQDATAAAQGGHGSNGKGSTGSAGGGSAQGADRKSPRGGDSTPPGGSAIGNTHSVAGGKTNGPADPAAPSSVGKTAKSTPARNSGQNPGTDATTVADPATTARRKVENNNGNQNNGDNKNDNGNQAPNPNCRLRVPANVLSAQGLATPFELSALDDDNGPCRESNPLQSAFVQANILDPATGRLFVYNPLVVDRDTQPAIAPAPPTLPAGAVIGIWFGFNGDTLTLKGADEAALDQGQCINGLRHSIFGQYSYCNAPAFFTAANAAIAAGRLKVPDIGTAADGMPCPTTRDFTLIDQDQSDNVTSTYLILGDGRTAQNTAANRAQLADAVVGTNGSDNRLLDAAVDPALGCTPWTVPDLADNNTPATGQGLNELQAAVEQPAPVALVPPNDPMAQVDGHDNLEKLNLYRAGVNMPPLGQINDEATTYCNDFLDLAPGRLAKNEQAFRNADSPNKKVATNLFTFLVGRAQQTFVNLNCTRFTDRRNPFVVTMDGDVVTDAKIRGTTAQGQDHGQGQTDPAAATQPTTETRHGSDRPPADQHNTQQQNGDQGSNTSKRQHRGPTRG